MRTKAEIIQKTENDRENIINAIADQDVDSSYIQEVTKLSLGTVATQLLFLTKNGYLSKIKEKRDGNLKARVYYKKTSKQFIKKTQDDIYALTAKNANEQKSANQKKMEANPNLRIIRLTETRMPSKGKIGTAYKGIASSFYVV